MSLGTRATCISEVGACSTGKSFRFVRACVRAVWLPSGIGSQILLVALFPFPLINEGRGEGRWEDFLWKSISSVDRQTPYTLSWIFQVHQQVLSQSGMGNWGDMRILLLLTCALSINNGSYAHKHILCRSVSKPVKDMDAIHPQDVHILCRSVSKPLKHMLRPCSQAVSTAMSVTSHLLVPTVFEFVPRRGASLIFRTQNLRGHVAL